MRMFRSAAVVCILAVAGCSSAVVPTPDIEGTIAARVSATVSAENGQDAVTKTERERVQAYFAELTLVTTEFYNTLSQAGMDRTLSYSDLASDPATALRITTGFVNRMQEIQPSDVPNDLGIAHSILIDVAQKEERWLSDYSEAVDRNDTVASERLVDQYHANLPLADLTEADQLLRGVAFDLNISGIHDEGDLRVTLLHPDYVPNNLELSRVQAAVLRFMADSGLNSVVPSTAFTSDFSAVDFNSEIAGSQTLYPNYLNENPTKYSYTWDESGSVAQNPNP